MKRFVSYLYSIYNNQKIHNAGFARIELRTGRNRIDIHLQENGYAGKSGTVYLFVRDQDNIQGISIGSIAFHGSQADFRYEQPEENIGQTSWEIMQMNGIAVLVDGRIAFLSQWDEKPVDINKFEVWNPEQAGGETSAETISDKKEGTMPETAPKADEAGRNSQAGQNGGDEAGRNLQTGQKGDYAANNPQSEQAGSGAADNEKSFQAGQGIMNSQRQTQEPQAAAGGMAEPPSRPSNIHTAEIQPQPQLSRPGWEQTWRYMLRMYPVLNQFDDKDNVLCVRIEIKDVRLLPEKYWSMINNSFLLHGFFNYRHLVFGRIGQSWFIGIPGIYQNQEHAMASIFGFPDFLPQAQKNERGEQPGYWYRILEI